MGLPAGRGGGALRAAGLLPAWKTGGDFFIFGPISFLFLPSSSRGCNPTALFGLAPETSPSG